MFRSPSRTLILAGFCFIAALLCSIYVSRSYSPAKLDTGKRLALEISLPNHSEASGGRVPFTSLLPRNTLKITDAQLAGDLTAVDVQTSIEGDVVNARLAIIYNDLKNQEWRKDRKEKVLKIYRFHEGDMARAMELAEFGIEPFQMRLFEMKPESLEPEKDVKVEYQTHAVEVSSIESDGFQTYKVTLKNVSGKNIWVLSVGSGDGITTSAWALAAKDYKFSPTVTQDFTFDESAFKTKGITIKMVLFDDWTYEGDEQEARRYIAKYEGVKFQLPKLAEMFDQVIQVDDAQLADEVKKLETRLWAMPEAIDKPSAIAFLKKKFPALSEATINALYEELKQGLYDARNMTLTMVSSFLAVQKPISANREKGWEQRVRQVLNDMKKHLETINNNLQ